MPALGSVRKEVDDLEKKGHTAACDDVRRLHLKQLYDHTKRPVVVYAVDFIHQPEKSSKVRAALSITLHDKEGFAEVIEDLPPGPLDLILHSPGGDPCAAESIVKMLRGKFDDIRAFAPIAAKSAATMMALSANKVALDERSELGPTDPQLVTENKVAPARAILDQFAQASAAIRGNPRDLPVWAPILQAYGPSLLVEASNAITMSTDLVQAWLEAYMFKGQQDAAGKATKIAAHFADHNNFKNHARNVGVDDAIDIGLTVEDLRKDARLKALVWDVYAAVAETFNRTTAFKIFENHLGQAYIRSLHAVLASQAPGQGGKPARPSPGPQVVPPGGARLGRERGIPPFLRANKRKKRR